MTTATAPKIHREKKVYTARPSAPFPKSAVAAIGRRLDLLTKKHGVSQHQLLNPIHIVEDAADPSSPLHKHFEWNNSKAAMQYRLAQARRIIGAIEVIVIVNGVETPVRQFHNVTIVNKENTETIRGYVSLERIERDPVLRSQVVEDAIGAIEHFTTKYYGILDTCGVTGDVQRIIKKLQKMAA